MAAIPDRIGKYEVIRRLGQGGMGAVYLARDPDLDRLLAIKLLRDIVEEELIQRFVREARAAGNLRHENVITVYDAGEHEHQPFMAMEYVDGVSLADIIRARQPLGLPTRLSYLEQICSGLHYAHAQGIVHRDIKPANLMVDGRGIVRILDFGIARVEGSGMTRDGALIGTLNYMSPEQMLGRAIDHRSDIFAFGAVAYELLAYQRAFPGTIQDGVLHRLPNEPPRPLAELCPGLPAELEAVVMRALAKQPHERFADLEEARVALRHIRRQLDPDDSESVPVPRRAAVPRAGAAGSASGSERHEFLERRARQMAYHRDAARAALAADDLDGAVAACEDALTLDPDDQEALQLLAEILQARDRRGAESKERRERDRTVRRHLADADVKLGKGDLLTAGQLVRQALTLDPQNATALALLSRIEQTATGEPIVPPTVVRPKSQTPAVAAEAVASAEEPAPSALRIGRVAMIGAATAAAVISAMVWMWSGSERTAPAEVTTPSRVTPPPAPPGGTAAPRATEPEPRAAPDVDSDRLLQGQLARIRATYENGDLEDALSEIGPLLSRTGDDRAQALARTIAISARQSMTSAAAAARKQKAADNSPGTFATAERARALSERAFGRNDFVEAGTQALRATANYSDAERQALAVAARPLPPPPAAARAAEAETPPSTRSPAQTAAPAGAGAGAVANSPGNPPPVATPPSIATPPPPAASTTAAAAAPAPPPAASALDLERPAILLALTRYQDAYRDRSLKALRSVYPSLPREASQGLERSFRDCRAYDFAYSNPGFALSADDPTAATVTAQTTYTCQPRSAQPAQSVSGQEVFLLRKIGDAWLIERAIMDSRTTR